MSIRAHLRWTVKIYIFKKLNKYRPIWKFIKHYILSFFPSLFLEVVVRRRKFIVFDAVKTSIFRITRIKNQRFYIYPRRAVTKEVKIDWIQKHKKKNHWNKWICHFKLSVKLSDTDVYAKRAEFHFFTII